MTTVQDAFALVRKIRATYKAEAIPLVCSFCGVSLDCERMILGEPTTDTGLYICNACSEHVYTLSDSAL